MTQAFTSCLTQNISYHKLLQRMTRHLRKQGYRQVPHISSEQFLKLDEPLVTRSRDGRPNSQTNSSSLCPISETGEGTGKLDMELAQMEAQVRDLRRKKAEEEQASMATLAQMQPSNAS